MNDQKDVCEVCFLIFTLPGLLTEVHRKIQSSINHQMHYAFVTVTDRTWLLSALYFHLVLHLQRHVKLYSHRVSKKALRKEQEMGFSF